MGRALKINDCENFLPPIVMKMSEFILEANPTDMSRSRVKIFISESRVTYDVERMLNYLSI